MELKKGLDVHTSDFWYDLTDGGYIKPEEMCVNPDDAAQVNDAIRVLERFRAACEDQIPDFFE